MKHKHTDDDLITNYNAERNILHCEYINYFIEYRYLPILPYVHIPNIDELQTANSAGCLYYAYYNT